MENYEVVDFRDPEWVPSEYDLKNKDKTMINVADGKIFLYRWGNGNKMEWKELLKNIGSLSDMILLTPGGSLVLPSRVGGNTKWEGARNLYTKGTKEWTEILLVAGIITPDTKVYIGNWACLGRLESGGIRGAFLPRSSDGFITTIRIIKSGTSPIQKCGRGFLITTIWKPFRGNLVCRATRKSDPNTASSGNRYF